MSKALQSSMLTLCSLFVSSYNNFLVLTLLGTRCYTTVAHETAVFENGRGGIRLRKLEIDVSEVKKLVELVESHHLDELTVEEADLSITVRGRAAVRAAQPVVHVASIEHAAEIEEEPFQKAEPIPEFDADDVFNIVAPIVGVFYRAPAPDAPPFVEVGDTIEVGTEVGLIEAMKVWSSVPSEVAGVVVDIPAENGKLVRQGDVLVRVRVHEEQT